VLVLDDFVLPEIKTRQITEFMKRFELGDMLLVTVPTGADTNLERSARNLGAVTLIRPEGVNVYDVLLHKHLVITRSAVEALSARLGAATRLGGAE